MDPLRQQFLFERADHPLVPRFNIAPSQPIAAVRLQETDQKRELAMLRWGLIPSWADDARIGHRMINARAETVAEKPSFRTAFKRRRCLILSDGYYEWQRRGQGLPKQPYLIEMKTQAAFAMAGIWDVWHDPQGSVVESCSILTTAANDLTKSIHDRMPVILEPANYELWLNVPSDNREALESLLGPYPSMELNVYPVSTLVNSPQHDSLQCIQPIDHSDT